MSKQIIDEVTTFVGQPWPESDTNGFGQLLHGVAGPALVESADVLERLCTGIPQNGRFLELGTWTCATPVYIIRHRPDVHVTCVDAFIGTPEKRLVRMLISLSNLILHEQIVFVRSTTQVFGELATRAWHRVLVDADHAEEACFRDLLIAQKLTMGDIVVHDYSRTCHPGVVAAVDRFCREHRWKIVDLVVSLAVLNRID